MPSYHGTQFQVLVQTFTRALMIDADVLTNC